LGSRACPSLSAGTRAAPPTAPGPVRGAWKHAGRWDFNVDNGKPVAQPAERRLNNRWGGRSRSFCRRSPRAWRAARRWFASGDTMRPLTMARIG
jgi:hypothetical protein